MNIPLVTPRERPHRYVLSGTVTMWYRDSAGSAAMTDIDYTFLGFITCRSLIPASSRNLPESARLNIGALSSMDTLVNMINRDPQHN